MLALHVPEPKGDHGQTGHANAQGGQFQRGENRQNSLHQNERRTPEQGQDAQDQKGQWPGGYLGMVGIWGFRYAHVATKVATDPPPMVNAL